MFTGQKVISIGNKYVKKDKRLLNILNPTWINYNISLCLLRTGVLWSTATMSCVVEREILDNLSRAQTAAVIDNEKQTTENRRKQKLRWKSTIRIWVYYQVVISKQSASGIIISIGEERALWRENKCTNKMIKKIAVNKAMLTQVTSTEQVCAYFCN